MGGSLWVAVRIRCQFAMQASAVSELSQSWPIDTSWLDVGIPCRSRFSLLG
jgi:hypothetical protein